MAQINFAEIFEKLKEDIANLASSTLKNYVNDAKTDGLKMLESMKEKLQKWTQLLADQKLTTSDFELLVNSQKDLIEMACLKQAGLAAIRVEQFKSSLFNLVVDTIFHLIPL
jgi:hypothetical protein